MVTLSGFADEISPDFDEQLDVLESEGIRHIELRSAWETNVVKLSDEQRRAIKKAVDGRGFAISSIGSPLGKIKVDDDFAPHVCDCETAIDAAKYFGAPHIRVFSFYVPKDEPVRTHRDEVMRRMGTLVGMAASAGLIMGHENERDIYGEKPAECRDLIDTVASPALRVIFDPANFIQAGVRPYEECWPVLRDDVLYFHIKDARLADGSVTPAGEGDGRIETILREKLATGWEGVLSLEPHLKVAGRAGGFSGPEAFRTASRALKRILEEIGAKWE